MAMRQLGEIDKSVQTYLEEKAYLGKVWERPISKASARNTLGGFWMAPGSTGRATPVSPFGTADALAPTDDIYKAVIPKFLYKPPYGYPRFIDIPEIRRLAATPYVWSCITTIINEIAAVPWEIVMKDEEAEPNDAHIEPVKSFFDNPNNKHESFEQQLRAIIQDILTIDSGVWVKVFNRAGLFSQAFVRDGGCLPYNTPVETDEGDIPIGKIVTEKIKCNVRTWNFKEKRFEWKPIINWVNNGGCNKWVRLWAKSDRKYRRLDSYMHKIWTPNGWRLGEEISVGDKIYTQTIEMNEIQKQILIGSLLGDGSITGKGTKYGKFYYKETHSIREKEYLEWKMRNFEPFAPRYAEYKSRYSDKHEETIKCEFRTEKNIAFEDYRNLKYPEPKTEILDEMGALALAVWIQDDGYCYTHRKSRQIEISTHCFTRKFLEYAIDVIRSKFGVDGKLRQDNRFEDSWILHFNSENTEKLIPQIKKYIHNSMARKIGLEKLDNEEIVDTEVKTGIVETEVYRKEYVNRYDIRYDIEVEDNHNFFARGKLVSNTFTMNPDKFGTFDQRADFIPIDFERNVEQQELQRLMEEKPAYYQYGWITGARPMPFGKREIVYVMLYPRPDSIYGRAPMEVLLSTVQMLLYGIDYYLEYHTDNNIPKGILRMVGATQDDIDKFAVKWQEAQKIRNEVGDWRKRWHKMPVTNMDGQFERIQFSEAELGLITQQQWFVKLVWACMGVTPSELGFTDDSNRACYTEDTRVMTENGLKYHWEIKPNEEKIMTIDPKTRKIGWSYPVDLFEYDVKNEEIIKFHSPNGIDMAVTPEHKIWYSTSGRYEDGFKEGQAKDTLNYKQHVRFDNKAEWEGKEIKEVKIPPIPMGSWKKNGDKEMKCNADDFLEFLGYIISEGGISKTKYLTTIGQVNKDNANKIEAVIKRLGLSYGRYVSKDKRKNHKDIIRFNIHRKQINTWLKDNVGNYCCEKRIPKQFKNVSKRQLRILFDALMLGDGTKDKRGFSNMSYFSNSIRLCEDVQEISMKLGYNAHVGGNIERDRVFRVFITDKTTKTIRAKNIIKEKYTGKVYCFKTDTGYYVTERNGKLSFQGNTEIVQSKVFRRKTIRPILQTLEYFINTQIIPEFETGVKLQDGRVVKGIADVRFRFDTYDIQEDKEKHEIWQMELRSRIRTPNEVRAEMGLDPVEGGDELGSGAPFGNFGNPFERERKWPGEESPGEARESGERKPGKEEKAVPETKPFAGYRNMKDCIRKNQDKRDPAAYCATIMRKVEGKALGRDSPLIPGPFEDMAKVIKGMLGNRKREVFKFLDRFKGEEKLAGVKALEDQLGRVEAMVSPEDLRQTIADIVSGVYYRAVDAQELKLNMNFMPRPKIVGFLQKSAFESVRGMTEEIANRIEQILRTGIMEGKSIPKLKREIAEVFDRSESRAETIARTETLRTSNRADYEAYNQAGIKARVEWIATVDDRTCPICRDLDGKTVPLNTKFKSTKGKGWEGFHPVSHPNCRCVTALIPED